MEKIFVAGHKGMVGSAIVRRLKAFKRCKIITCPKKKLDLLDRSAVDSFLNQSRPDIIINAAAKVGGIMANKTLPAEFIYQNLAININLVDAAFRQGVPRLINLGSSCIYPKIVPLPISEESLLSGKLEPTNDAYAIAKIAGLEMCRHYRSQYGVMFHSVLPTNLYGPGDNYHLDNAHVLPALIRKFHEAKMEKKKAVEVWGSGTPLREFLYVDDLADAIVHLMTIKSPPDYVNIGTGRECSITKLCELIKEVVGFNGELHFDSSKPDGVKSKVLNVSSMEAIGWKANVKLRDGIKRTYADFLKRLEDGTLRINDYN